MRKEYLSNRVAVKSKEIIPIKHLGCHKVLGLFAVVCIRFLSPTPTPSPYWVEVSDSGRSVLSILSGIAGLGQGGGNAWNFKTMLEETRCEFGNGPTVQYYLDLFITVKIT